ncbi:hypothetical protein BD324DRAFT_580570 [Kockovaella imperatae]|uniref:LIM zinc-binding domain-containing protein n=1 Tax=Kockovaella imperatae TaxID=4999 RepID=A0A1Y1UH87_9TREE|nr:hypothetical protein BD324DRAFT_580570 [Kockovaella imperatae]ORX36445.1 hypothetical protein BD324DRAFT_580570 [Kockovaella imperatae]
MAGPSNTRNGYSLSHLERAISQQHSNIIPDTNNASYSSGVSHTPDGIIPIPAAQPRAPYEPPVFRTFLERKKERDRARFNGGGESAFATTGQDSARVVVQETTPAPIAPSRPLPSPVVKPSAFQASNATDERNWSPSTPGIIATVERSDTISSIRSLDRMGFSSPTKRPLPQPPVTVNGSRSLDRGNLGEKGQTSRWRMDRKQPSIVEEERGESPVPVSPTANPIASSQSPTVPAISIQIPIITLPDDDPPSPGRTGVILSGLPVISVSTEHSDEEKSPLSQSIALDMPTRVHPTQAILCAGCRQPIIGRIVNAMKQRWHPGCFKCDECGGLLEHVSSFEWEGKAYCHLDYHDASLHIRAFAHRCYHCKTPIVDSRFVTLNDPGLGERFYHELHFFCSECGDPFLDPSKSSAPGATGAEQEEEGETNPFVIHKGHPYCENCHIRLHKPKCKACQQPIPDVAVSAMGAKWHKECFVCSHCSSAFANNLFFPKDGQALCTSCYEALVIQQVQE